MGSFEKEGWVVVEVCCDHVLQVPVVWAPPSAVGSLGPCVLGFGSPIGAVFPA